MKKILEAIDQKLGKEVFSILFVSILLGLFGAYAVNVFWPEIAGILLWIFMPAGLVLIISLIITFKHR